MASLGDSTAEAEEGEGEDVEEEAAAACVDDDAAAAPWDVELALLVSVVTSSEGGER